MCHELESRSYLQYQGYSAHIAKIRTQTITFYLQVASEFHAILLPMTQGRQLVIPGNSAHSHILGTICSHYRTPSSLNRVPCLLKRNKQIQRIVVPRSATNLTLKKVKGHRQGHDMVPPERSCHKEHTCQVSKLYL